MLRPCCEDVSNKKFMHVGVHKLLLSACDRNVEATSKKKVYVLESSSNLDNWMPVKIYKGGSSIEFKLDDPVSELRGYYRVKVKSE